MKVRIMRRYLFSNHLNIKSALNFDVLIVGSGIAGLYAALNLDKNLSCAVMSKGGIDNSDSWLAQGGIAAAVSDDDSPDLHYEDTITAGAGLCDNDAVRILVNNAPRDIETLLSMKVPFDRDKNGKLQTGREGGHHKSRVVHAGGDATGKETVKALVTAANERSNLTFLQNTFLVDILTDDTGVCGAIICKDGYHMVVYCTNIILCTGGIGQMYEHSTNASIATGDGQAAALRAGAKLSDMEFIQFHPTGLYSKLSESRSFLISEAVRGYGAVLVNNKGDRFMLGKHPMAELAPRDIVARGIAREMTETGQNHVFLNINGKTGEQLSGRFPTIYGECLSRGIDISKQPIPVCPVQHYIMGGIATDLNGSTNIAGLYACGEVARTGAQGANRLASNSMLECLVFGRRAAQSILPRRQKAKVSIPAVKPCHISADTVGLNALQLKSRIRKIMSSDCWIIRNKKDLEQGYSQLAGIIDALEDCDLPDREWMETYNMVSVSAEIIQSALNRKTSIGAHYRED